MPRTRHRLSHRLEYLLLRALEALLAAIPRGVALRLGAAMGTLLHRSGAYRGTVRRNLVHVGFWNEQEMAVITRKLYRTMGRYVVDFLRPSRNPPPNDGAGMGPVENAIARGRGTIVVLAHFGSWEALAAIFGKKVPHLDAVSRPMKNKLVERWLTRKRAKTGITEIDSSKALRPMISSLKSNHIVAVLIDQNARSQGTMAPFLGKPASTVRTVAGLLNKLDCTVILAYALLEDDGAYRVHVESGRALDVPRHDQEAFVAAYQREHNDVLSCWIRQRPEHYFGWFHRRWLGTPGY